MTIADNYAAFRAEIEPQLAKARESSIITLRGVKRTFTSSEERREQWRKANKKRKKK